MAPTEAPRPSAVQRYREASRALDQQRRSTLASAVALLVTFAVWGAALALHHRLSDEFQSAHPRLIVSLLSFALIGAFPIGMLIRRWMLA